jgi:hypothetical protein
LEFFKFIRVRLKKDTCLAALLIWHLNPDDSVAPACLNELNSALNKRSLLLPILVLLDLLFNVYDLTASGWGKSQLLLFIAWVKLFMKTFGKCVLFLCYFI